MQSVEGTVATLRRRLTASQDLVDVLVALGLFAAAAAVAAWGHTFGPLTPVSLVLIAAQTLPVALRRRYPLPVLATTGAATITLSLLGLGESGGNFGVLIALYTVAADTDRRTATWAAAITAVGITLSFIGYVLREPDTIANSLGVALLYAITWIVGDSIRQRREERARYALASQQHERERDERARLAVAEERARIARELHDVVAHHVSVMVVQATAARRVAATDPEASAAALGAVEEAGRTALAEMRRLLEVLREEERELAPRPSLHHVEPVLAQVRDAGLPVTLEIDGEPRDLPAGIDLAAYRIVQESLTNVVKHAGPAAIVVRLGYGAEQLEVEVTDDGHGAAAAIGEVSAGHGLVGMRERVLLYGGTLEAGPRLAGGYRVHATFPLEPVAERAPETPSATDPARPRASSVPAP